ncbi:MAG: UDP-3-O-(3-hydroxymyristoyl)glucosamine N-acyltransferase [Terracidiphilus sp.]|jgi:UDP-3-O-[3-hydroxymyristoyl] glucosamine N-acyltransferase
MNLGELVEKLGGKLVQGNPEWMVDSVNSVELAGALELVFAEDAASAAKALASSAGGIVLRAGLAEPYPPGYCIVETDQPRLWFALAAKLLKPLPSPSGVHPTAVIGQHVELGENVTIGACAVIEDCAHIGSGTRIEAGAVIGQGVRIGEDCRIYPRAVLYHGTTLGNRVVVHAGAVLGADGFGYVRDATTGAYTQCPQQGTLVIEDDVEIGANTTIDRGALGETRIRRGTKFDNLVHVGHNCEIGEDVILVALTGISGSSTVGNGAVIAGQVGIGDHAHVGPGVILGGQAGVLSGKTVTNEGMGVKPGTVLWGTPARPLTQALREIAVVARLAKGSRKAPGSQ